MPEGYGDTDIAVGVTQGSTIVAKPPHKKFNRPAYLSAVRPTRSLAPRLPRRGAVAAGGQGQALFISNPGLLAFMLFQGTDERLAVFSSRRISEGVRHTGKQRPKSETN